MRSLRFASLTLLAASFLISALGIHAQDATAEATAEAPQPFTLLNLNTVSKEDFLTIPDMSDRMTREFEEYRPYVSISQFRQEIGKYVDEAQVAAYEEFVYVPVEINDSDSETLQQIPGITPEIADTLIAGRPYDSVDTFVAALNDVLSPAQAEYGANFVEGYIAPTITATEEAQ